MESLTSGTLAGTGPSGARIAATWSRWPRRTASRLPRLRRRALRPRLAVRGRAFRARPRDGSPRSARPSWPRRASGSIEPGQYLAYEDGGDGASSPLEREWTRIGRTLAADVRFDDPTVSRRHALIVRQADGVRVLDDRSLNGVFVNGERVEWRTLADGDEIVVGPLPPALPRRAGRGTAGVDRARGSTPTGSGGRAAARGGEGRRGPARQPGLLRRCPYLQRVAETIAVLSQKGGTGKTTDRAHARRRLPPRRAQRARHRPRPAGQPVATTSTSRPTPRRRSPTCSRAGPRPPRPSHDGIIPANLVLAEAELALAGQDGPRADAAQGAASDVARRLRRHPHRLPAGARPADRQRARRRRLRADQRRGAVLRAAGRRAGARGHRAGARRPQPRPRVARRAVQHRRHAHGALARGLRRRCASTSATRCSTRRSARRSPTPSRPSRRVSILDHRPDLGADYLALADELLERLGLDARGAARCGARRRCEPRGAASGALALLSAAGCGWRRVAARPAPPRGRAPATAAPPRPTPPRRSGPAAARSCAARQLRAPPGGRVLARIAPRTEFGSPPCSPWPRRRAAGCGVLHAGAPNGRLGWIARPTRGSLPAARDARRRPLARRLACVAARAPGRALHPVAVGAPADADADRPLRAHRPAAPRATPAAPYGCCVLALSGHQPNSAQGWPRRRPPRDPRRTPRPGRSAGRAALGCMRARPAGMRRLMPHGAARRRR